MKMLDARVFRERWGKENAHIKREITDDMCNAREVEACHTLQSCLINSLLSKSNKQSSFLVTVSRPAFTASTWYIKVSSILKLDFPALAMT